MSDFHSETASLLLLDGLLYLVRVNTSKKLEWEGNGSQDLEQDLTTYDDLESKLSEQPGEKSSERNSGTKKNSRQSERTQAP